MGRNCQFYRPLTLSHKAWSTINKHCGRLLSSVSHLSKLHRLTTREERSTQDREPRVHQAHQQTAVRYMDGRNTWGKQCLWLLHVRGACNRSQASEARKVSGSGFYFPEVCTPRRFSSQIMITRFPHFLHVPNQNPQDLEQSTNSCDP